MITDLGCPKAIGIEKMLQDLHNAPHMRSDQFAVQPAQKFPASRSMLASITSPGQPDASHGHNFHVSPCLPRMCLARLDHLGRCQ